MWPFDLVRERRSFVTGSSAYGENYRSSKSDTDLVVYVSEETLKDLQPFIDKTIVSRDGPWPNYGRITKGGRIKLGDFDLILVSSPEAFDRWKEITDHYIKNPPLTRKEVVGTFKRKGSKYQ